MDLDRKLDLDRNLILKHLNSLSNIKDRLIFALYTLQPARRPDWRLTVLTTETDEKKLDDDDINYLSISPKGKTSIFNYYRTDIKCGQHVLTLTDP